MPSEQLALLTLLLVWAVLGRLYRGPRGRGLVVGMGMTCGWGPSGSGKRKGRERKENWEVV